MKVIELPTINFIGKDKVSKYHQQVPYKVLNHVDEKSCGSSDNKIIHGDNLEVLKSLLPEYQGKIKCIYIDPPYNTGNENWIFNDNVNDPKLQKWLGQVVGLEGEDFNRHDKWLCMMYPRLQLMQKLLSDDGYIFISINFKDEFHYLRCICDEIFGVNNYVGTITWESTTQPTNSGNSKFGLQVKTEPILFYKGRNAENIFKLTPSEIKNSYPHEGRFGKCRFEIIETSDAGSFNRPTMKFKILGQYPREGRRWKIGEDTARQLELAGKVEIVNGIVKKAVYPEDEIDKIKYLPFWSHFKAEEYGTAQSGKEILNTIMNESLGFDTVKPPKLIEGLLSHLDKNIIVLDAFAGSGTTAHAVINLNNSDGGDRKFILIERENYCDSITAERVRRIGGKFNYYEVGDDRIADDKFYW